jgi:hypothetical protein
MSLFPSRAAATAVVPMPLFWGICAFSHTSRFAVLRASRSLVLTGEPEAADSAKLFTMAATAWELATSPLAIPPMPSQTTKMPSISS